MSMLTNAVQRVRLTFSVRWPLQYASILDMGRLWERLLRRAQLPVVYTQGYNPHIRLQFADALPVGYTSDCEAVDIYLAKAMPVEGLPRLLTPHAPPGLSITDAAEVDLKAKAPQALMRSACYTVSIETDAPSETIAAALDELLARESIPYERERRGRIRKRDLRRLIYDLEYLSGCYPWHEIQMRLRCGSHGSGRPAEILEASNVSISDIRVHRTKLIWDEGKEDAS